MQFGILDESSPQGRLGVVFVPTNDAEPQGLVGGLHPVPPECLFLFDEDFWACLPSNVFPSDLYALLGAVARFGWDEASHNRPLDDYRIIGVIAPKLGEVARSCIIALEHAGGLKRPYGTIRTAAHVLTAVAAMRRAGREAQQCMSRAA